MIAPLPAGNRVAVMDKKTVVTVLEEIALLLDLSGENPFKSRSYANVARQVEQTDEDIQTLVDEGRLREIKGVGDALEEKITELVKTGKLQYHEDLRAKFPESLFDLFRIPGLGAKRIKTFYEDLGVTSLDELEQAIEDDKVSHLKGFGKKMQDKVLEGIAFIKLHSGQYLFDKAFTQAEALKAHLEENAPVKRLEIAGSLRRRKEIVKDIDVIASSIKPNAVMDEFIAYPEVDRITGHGETKSSVVLKSGIAADLRVVTDAEFPYALAHFTGSKEHNVHMRQRAKDRGMKLNEYGLFKGEKRIACKDEAAVYAKLDLPFIPPELREDMGEFDEETIPDLLEEEDLVGVFHCHSTYSDGVNTVEEMAKAAKERGYKYLTITDHSQSAAYAGGLRPQDVARQQKEVDALNEKLKGFKVLKGIESDILRTGALDYKNDVLATFDLVIASVHSVLNMDVEEATKRVIAAVKNPFTTILGHPSGRLLLARDGFQLDYDAVFDACAAHNVAVEINANCRRLDLDWRFVRRAKEKGVKLCIGPDAHAVDQLDNIRYGVGIARKGWLGKNDVLNTMTAAQFMKWKKK